MEGTAQPDYAARLRALHTLRRELTETTLMLGAHLTGLQASDDPTGPTRSDLSRQAVRLLDALESADLIGADTYSDRLAQYADDVESEPVMIVPTMIDWRNTEILDEWRSTEEP